MPSENKLNNLDRAVIVALGSNLPGQYEDSQALLEAALAALDEAGLKIVRRSRWWRSAAWPNPSDPAFLNGVALVETDLSPAEVLSALHALEDRFDRQRIAANAPRTLDLDLIAYGRALSDHPAIPHPRAHQRLFVMGPLAEIAPDWRHPISGETTVALAAQATVGLDAEPVLRQDQTMNEKPPGVEEEALDWEGPPMDEAYVDAWIERNRVPLEKLIAEADADVAAGRVYSSDEFWAELRRRRAARRQGG